MNAKELQNSAECIAFSNALCIHGITNMLHKHKLYIFTAREIHF